MIDALVFMVGLVGFEPTLAGSEFATIHLAIAHYVVDFSSMSEKPFFMILEGKKKKVSKDFIGLKRKKVNHCTKLIKKACV